MLLRFRRSCDLVTGVGQLVHLGVAAEAQTDRRARLAIVEPQRAQHMARPPRAACAGGTGRWGPTGWTRLFNAQFGGQISWLLPTALFLLVAMLALTWRSPRTARTRAAMLLFGGWLLLTGAAISLGKGIIHPYYTVALAPAIGAIIGIGATMLWQRRQLSVARMMLAAAMAVTASSKSLNRPV